MIPFLFYLSSTTHLSIYIFHRGNPVTSGIQDSVDYFITGERLENFFQTQNDSSVAHEQYSEQHVLFQGQGIWYDSVQAPKLEAGILTRANMGFEQDWTIYMIPQSVFKIHPIFDDVLRNILCKDLNAHLVFVRGRVKEWTQTLQDRFRRNLVCSEDGKNDNDSFERLHFVPRMPGSDAFLRFISLADMLLHPFPFGGSKTALDSLVMSIPFVALQGDYLRGRMATSLLYSLGNDEFVSECCVADSPSVYTQKALRIGTRERERGGAIDFFLSVFHIFWGGFHFCSPTLYFSLL